MIEVEYRDGVVIINNDPVPGRYLTATPIEWAIFAAGVKNGDFDELVPAVPPEGQP